MKAAAEAAIQRSLAVGVTAEGEHQRDRDQHFHESGVVVVVDVGAVDPAAEARRP